MLCPSDQCGAGPAPGPPTSFGKLEEGMPTTDDPVVNAPCRYSTVMPIDRAVPAMILAAWSMSCALRSLFLVSAISRTWSQLTLATLVLCGSPEPFSTPAALSSSLAAGGVLSLTSNDRASY